MEYRINRRNGDQISILDFETTPPVKAVILKWAAHGVWLHRLVGRKKF